MFYAFLVMNFIIIMFINKIQFFKPLGNFESFFGKIYDNKRATYYKQNIFLSDNWKH